MLVAYKAFALRHAILVPVVVFALVFLVLYRLVDWHIAGIVGLAAAAKADGTW